MMEMQAIAVFDIDGVIRDVTNSYRRALADTVEHFTNQEYRPTMEDIDNLKGEGIWNNDWEGSQELIYRYFEQKGKPRTQLNLDYPKIVDFFQSRYRGSNLDSPLTWNGYITKEPLLVTKDYFSQLTENKIAWGFFSGATRGSAQYILEYRLGLANPVLIAMDDAPGKPDPTGLFLAVELIEQRYSLAKNLPVIYLGDTVADMQTIVKAKSCQPQREWVGMGILPPHVHQEPIISRRYSQQLLQAGAKQIVRKITEFTQID
jgi:HAD superfamily phosphatase